MNRRTFVQTSASAASAALTRTGAPALAALATGPFARAAAAPPAPVTAFTTGGHIVYHLRPATVRAGERAVIAAAYDGAVLCHTPEGKKLWQAATGGYFPFDVAVGDIDGDGLDETLVASADGSLYAFDHDGARLWVFAKVPPLFQVCIARLAGGGVVILTGGVEQVLYQLSPAGKLLKSLPTEHCIRHLRAGDILGERRDFVAMTTASTGLTGRLSLLLVDPTDLSIRWTRTNLGTFAHNSGRRFFSLLLVDLNHDGRAEILLSNSWGERGRIYAFNSEGNPLFSTTDPRIPNQPYRMNLLRHVKLADDEFVLGHFGHVLILYNLDGTCREVLAGRFAFADGAFDPVNQTWYMGSAVSGGDEIIAVRLDRPGWRQAVTQPRANGRLAEIERNLARLREQIAGFRPPAYQPAPRGVTVIAREQTDHRYQHLKFVSSVTWSQKFTDRSELWCRDIDQRKRYDMTADQIVAAAAKLEGEGRDFILDAGHGHAIHFPLSTFERILAAAPRHLWGFSFAEVEGVDELMQEVVERILLPVAELCRARGKHIAFHMKNIFWNGTCYVPFWKKVLLNAKFQDVFVPALEETNCRTQELSLAGRVGLWQTGAFNHWSCRLVTDNANFDRMWEYAGQQVLSHHFRQLVSTAALGADVFYNTIPREPLGAQLLPFYDLIEKGIVHIPQRAELLSLSEVSLGMASPPAAEYIAHGINGHGYRYPRDEQPAMVFDRLDCYWAGAPLAPHDFSRYAMRLDRRMCNFLPENPYGLVPIVPADTPASQRPGRKFTTDGRYFYDAGARREATEFRPTVEAALREAAARLPVRVAGPAHWSVVRLDPTHVRITLIDPGYLDPAERAVEIICQHLKAVAATDILSGETLAADAGRLALRIPAGTLRIIDLTHV
jgi:hypothetical protein